MGESLFASYSSSTLKLSSSLYGESDTGFQGGGPQMCSGRGVDGLLQVLEEFFSEEEHSRIEADMAFALDLMWANKAGMTGRQAQTRPTFGSMP